MGVGDFVLIGLILLMAAALVGGIVSTLIAVFAGVGLIALLVLILLTPHLIRGFRQGWREEKRKAEDSNPNV